MFSLQLLCVDNNTVILWISQIMWLLALLSYLVKLEQFQYVAKMISSTTLNFI